MRGNNVLGIIFANADDSCIPELTGIRSMASVPFGGGYRLIDFTLSNMVSAGIGKVGVVTNNNYQSLMDHISGGKPWDLSRKASGLYLLPPFTSDAAENYSASRLGALKNITHFLARSDEEYVLLSDCTYVANLDLGELFDYHEKNGFDMTMLYKHGVAPRLAVQPVLDCIEDGRITKLSLADYSGGEVDYAVKAVLMKKSLLERLINESAAKGRNSFEQSFFLNNVDRLKLGAFKVESFCPVIDSLESYFEANFALLDPDNYKALFNGAHPVFTKVYDDMPAVYGLESDVKNSLIADGCIIEGEVENSILFRDCRVEKGAVVKNSIVMSGGFIGQNAMLNYCVLDKHVTVRGGKTLSGADSFPVYIGRNIQI